MERQEAWSAGPGAFCVLAGLHAPGHARSHAPCRVERLAQRAERVGRAFLEVLFLPLGFVSVRRMLREQ